MTLKQAMQEAEQALRELASFEGEEGYSEAVEYLRDVLTEIDA